VFAAGYSAVFSKLVHRGCGLLADASQSVCVGGGREIYYDPRLLCKGSRRAVTFTCWFRKFPAVSACVFTVLSLAMTECCRCCRVTKLRNMGAWRRERLGCLALPLMIWVRVAGMAYKNRADSDFQSNSYFPLSSSRASGSFSTSFIRHSAAPAKS
jgi:hypothetical protein